MSFTGTLPSLKRGLMRNNHSDLPEKFKYNDLQEREVIGRGSYGIVYKASYHDGTIVVKNIMGELTEGENNFVKEAKLLRSLQHKNIVAFKNFCNTPYAMMLEYVYLLQNSLLGYSYQKEYAYMIMIIRIRYPYPVSAFSTIPSLLCD